MLANNPKWILVFIFDFNRSGSVEDANEDIEFEELENSSMIRARKFYCNDAIRESLPVARSLQKHNYPYSNNSISSFELIQFQCLVRSSNNENALASAVAFERDHRNKRSIN